MNLSHYKIFDLGCILNQEEAEHLSSLIKKNRDIWTHASVYWGEAVKEKPMNFLGSPIYPAKATPGAYRKLRTKSNQFLIENASFILQKTLKSIGELYGCSTIEQLPDTSLPGFHVFSSSVPQTCEYDYHVDSDFLEYYREFGIKDVYNFNNFYSVTVTIEVPVAGASVDFKIGWDDEVISLPYKVGHCYVWKADIWHKIGNVKLNGSDYRITYQAHFIRNDDKILYYW